MARAAVEIGCWYSLDGGRFFAYPYKRQKNGSVRAITARVTGGKAKTDSFADTDVRGWRKAGASGVPGYVKKAIEDHKAFPSPGGASKIVVTY